MNRKSGSGSGPFLMEMLAVVGFFILCASICVTVFAKADQISREARDLNQAVLKAQSLAEEMKAGAVELDKGDVSAFWDKNWEETDKEQDKAYTGHAVRITNEDGMEHVSISIQDTKGKVIYQLEMEHYVGVSSGEGGE